MQSLALANDVTEARVTDVVGSIDPAYGTRDLLGNVIAACRRLKGWFLTAVPAEQPSKSGCESADPQDRFDDLVYLRANPGRAARHHFLGRSQALKPSCHGTQRLDQRTIHVTSRSVRVVGLPPVHHIHEIRVLTISRRLIKVT